MMIVRHGFMLVGGPFASKTKVLEVLATTLTLLNKRGQMEEYKTMYKVTLETGVTIAIFTWKWVVIIATTVTLETVVLP